MRSPLAKRHKKKRELPSRILYTESYHSFKYDRYLIISAPSKNRGKNPYFFKYFKSFLHHYL